MSNKSPEHKRTEITPGLFGCIGTIIAAVISGIFLLLATPEQRDKLVQIVPFLFAETNTPEATQPPEAAITSLPLLQSTLPFTETPALTAFPTQSSTYPESDHPYANNYDYAWTISRPGASQIRIHFSKLELSTYDYLNIYDKDNKKLADYGYTEDLEIGGWTEWFTGDTLILRLVTDGSSTAYGLMVDNVETREAIAPSAELPESYHPYANNYDYAWTISRPGASQIRIHFSKLELSTYDYLNIYDKDNKKLADYGYTEDLEIGGWTEWFTGDTLILRLVTDGSSTAYGLTVDNVETR